MGARLLLLKSRALLPPTPTKARTRTRTAIRSRCSTRWSSTAATAVPPSTCAASRTSTAAPTAARPPRRKCPLRAGSMASPRTSSTRCSATRSHGSPRSSRRPNWSARACCWRDRVSLLAERLERERTVSFRDLIGAATSRLVVIVDFLAVLDLIRQGFLEARQDGAFGESHPRAHRGRRAACLAAGLTARRGGSWRRIARVASARWFEAAIWPMLRSALAARPTTAMRG